MNKLRMIAVLLAGTALAGCVATQNPERIGQQTREAERRLTASADTSRAVDTSRVRMRDGYFVGQRAVLNQNGDPLPARFQTDNGITLVDSRPMTLRDAAAHITQRTGIPVVVAPTVATGSASASGSADSTSPGAAFGALNANMNTPVPATSLDDVLNGLGAMPYGSEGQEGTAVIEYTGRLSGLLDVVAATYNVTWRYEGGRIVIDRMITQSFDVPALAVNHQQTYGSGRETSAHGSESSAAFAAFDDLEAALGSIVGDGGSVNVNRSTGTVTVTASPSVVSRVSNHITQISARLGRQVAINVQVYSLSLNSRESFDLNVSTLFRDGTSGLNLGRITEAGVVPVAAGIGGAGLGWALINSSSNFNGSSALLEALSSQGQVSVVTTASVTTSNGVPVPLEVGSERDYVSRVETTTTGESTATSLETSEIFEGFRLQMVPRIDESGDTLLHYGIDISELVGDRDGFDVFESGGQQVQLRRMNRRNFVQQARIPSSGTLVLAGFEQVRTQASKSGVGHANFPLFGGSRFGSTQREIIVIAITPTVLDINRR